MVCTSKEQKLLIIYCMYVCSVCSSKYRLDAETMGSTGFRILKTHIKSHGPQPKGLYDVPEEF